jgi:carbonic anhydrase
MPSARQFAILTCMDARLDPTKYKGLAEGDASGWHDTNAGGETTDGKYINWLTIGDQKKSDLEDVQRILSNSMVPSDIPIYGYIYDCKTGNLVEVLEATEAGVAR